MRQNVGGRRYTEKQNQGWWTEEVHGEGSAGEAGRM